MIMNLPCLMSCYCSVALPRGVMRWSAAVCDCAISLSYSLTVGSTD